MKTNIGHCFIVDANFYFLLLNLAVKYINLIIIITYIHVKLVNYYLFQCIYLKKSAGCEEI